MNCNCVEDIKGRLVGNEYKGTGRIIKKAILVNGALMHPHYELVTNSEFELEVEGMKRVQKQHILHRFCPWCGTQIEKEDTNGQG